MSRNAHPQEHERQMNCMNNKTPLFSIIIPVYGVEAFLPQAIESVLAQSVSDWEMILVDDGSKDRSGAICDDYAARDRRIRVIHKENGGLVSARQAGANICTGQYILNIDGDDYIESTLLEAIQRAVLETEPDIIAFNMVRVSETGEYLNRLCNGLPSGLYQGKALQELKGKVLFDKQMNSMNCYNSVMLYGICAKAIKRELYIPLQNQVPQKIKNGEDVAVTVPAVCSCKTLLLIEECGYRYRFRGESMINSFRRGELQSLTELLLFLQNNAAHIPDESIVGYVYRQIEIHIISAARNMRKYSQFKKYIDGELNPLLKQMIKRFDCSKLKLDHRIRAQLIKMGQYRIIHLIYGLYGR